MQIFKELVSYFRVQELYHSWFYMIIREEKTLSPEVLEML